MEKEDVIKSIFSAIHECVGIEYDTIQKESEIVDELGMNSLEILSVISALEKEYHIHYSTKSLREIFTVEDLADQTLSLMKD